MRMTRTTHWRTTEGTPHFCLKSEKEKELFFVVAWSRLLNQISGNSTRWHYPWRIHMLFLGHQTNVVLNKLLGGTNQPVLNIGGDMSPHLRGNYAFTLKHNLILLKYSCVLFMMESKEKKGISTFNHTGSKDYKSHFLPFFLTMNKQLSSTHCTLEAGNFVPLLKGGVLGV